MPINPDNADKFDPVDGVPTVSQLLTQLDQSDLTMSSNMQASGAISMQADAVCTKHVAKLLLLCRISGSIQACRRQ